MSDAERKAQSLDFLRRAINLAVLAGNSTDDVETVVDDQIFGIIHDGNGDPNKMLQKKQALDREIQNRINQLRNQKGQ